MDSGCWTGAQVLFWSRHLVSERRCVLRGVGLTPARAARLKVEPTRPHMTEPRWRWRKGGESDASWNSVSNNRLSGCPRIALGKRDTPWGVVEPRSTWTRKASYGHDPPQTCSPGQAMWCGDPRRNQFAVGRRAGVRRTLAAVVLDSRRLYSGPRQTRGAICPRHHPRRAKAPQRLEGRRGACPILRHKRA